MADAMIRSLRGADTAYRVGGDEFVILLPETSKRHVGDIVERVAASGAPAFSWGAATYVDDTDDRDQLVALADDHLIRRRRARRA
jgi:GGDEF domain-containing protein